MTRSFRRVAALYDVHGNLPAFDAALSDANAAEVDLILLGGDLALGPMPCEVLDLVSELGSRALALRGNCDRLMVDAYKGRPLGSLPPSVQEQIAWAASQLQPKHRDFLAALPETITLDVDGLGSVLFCHATPRSDEEIITIRTPDERLRSIFGSVSESIVVCGHTHMQFERRCGNVRVVNAGSVGMPCGEAGAQWLLLGPGLELKRTVYDGQSAAEHIERTAYPNAALFAERHVLHPPSAHAMLEALEPGR
jgi:putative phosphoesterase